MELSRALYTHSKLLVAALNGPAIGLSAAMLGHFDFIYAVESAWIMTPFSTLSLVAEGELISSLFRQASRPADEARSQVAPPSPSLGAWASARRTSARIH